jgi:hypothetical protein
MMVIIAMLPYYCPRTGFSPIAHSPTPQWKRDPRLRRRPHIQMAASSGRTSEAKSSKLPASASILAGARTYTRVMPSSR